MSTAVDELRAASARLRELAGRTTDAPWSTAWNGQQYELRGPDEAAYPIAEWTYAINTTEPKVSEERAECDTADADWIATLHPGIGLALAELLETAADYVADDSPNHPTHVVRALAVARLINTGSQP